MVHIGWYLLTLRHEGILMQDPALPPGILDGGQRIALVAHHRELTGILEGYGIALILPG
jgi:hypothetical protein